MDHPFEDIELILDWLDITIREDSIEQDTKGNKESAEFLHEIGKHLDNYRKWKVEDLIEKGIYVKP
jgi:hypothetical protein